MPDWNIGYYETSTGRCPVFDFIEKLSLEIQGKIRNAFRLLEEFGPQIGLPHLKSIKGYKPLYEIRILGSASVRLICVLQKRKFIILHAFRKKTQRIPRKELKTSLKRLRTITP